MIISSRGLVRGANAVALLVAAHIYKRGIRCLQLSSFITRGRNAESKVLLNNFAMDSSIIVAPVAEPLRCFPVPSSQVGGFAE